MSSSREGVIENELSASRASRDMSLSLGTGPADGACLTAV